MVICAKHAHLYKLDHQKVQLFVIKMIYYNYIKDILIYFLYLLRK